MARNRRITGFTFLFICLLFGIVLTTLNIYQLRHLNTSSSTNVDNGIKPIVWVNADHPTNGYLNHLYDVLDRLGFTLSFDAQIGNWDLLWSHNYPFVSLANNMQKLQPHQKVNHFPGSGFITNKATLASLRIPSVPIAFQIPKERVAFLEEVKKNPEKLWVVKNSGHRGIAVTNPQDINFDDPKRNSFVQEFISKPLLVNGRMFDIGVYTVLTSINPLRVYVFEGDVLLRFCTKDYLPFDAKDLKKYVIGDDYTPPRHIPAFQDIYLTGKFSRLETMILYLNQNGKNGYRIWKKIKKIIAQVFEMKEKHLVEASKKFKSSRNFFELVRFDFMLDEDGNIWLLEANMSPNLSSAAHAHNKLMYEKVIYNMLSLTGVAHLTRGDTDRSEEGEMQVSDEDLHANEICATEKCLKSCINQHCRLCDPCLHQKTREDLKTAFLEHMNKKNYARIYPQPMNQEKAGELSKNQTWLSKLTVANQLMHEWFLYKCLRSSTWCS